MDKLENFIHNWTTKRMYDGQFILIYLSKDPKNKYEIWVKEQITGYENPYYVINKVDGFLRKLNSTLPICEVASCKTLGQAFKLIFDLLEKENNG